MMFEHDQFALVKDNHKTNTHMLTVEPTRYLESDDDETLISALDDFSNLDLYPSLHNMQSFQEELEDSSDARIIQCQNTYFMDGGARFISLPSLGNSNTKLTLPLSQVFEDWFANKLYYSNDTVNIPILEDNAEILAEDIMNQIKMRGVLSSTLKGSNILIKIRADHIYTYHHRFNGQPFITQDMEDFFQQFPLFVEVLVYMIPHSSHETKILLTIQNAACYEPYCIMETIE